MSKSIADQLLGLGLADKKQIQKDKAEKRKADKQSRKHKDANDDEAKLAVEAARKKKLEHDRQLNLARQAQADKKAILAQVKQMVESAKIHSDAGDIKYNFADRLDNKIKSIYVTDAVQQDLSRGRLAIAVSDGRYYVITKEVADKIAERSENSIVFIADANNDAPDEDDPYKDFVIPDDLMW